MTILMASLIVFAVIFRASLFGLSLGKTGKYLKQKLSPDFQLDDGDLLVGSSFQSLKTKKAPSEERGLLKNF